MAAAGGGRSGRPVVVLFLLLLVATGLVDALFPVPAPEPIGAEKREDERLRSSARLRDGTLARLVERDLRLRSRVRRTLGSYYALALFRFLDEAQGHVVVGRDGWLFLPGRTRLPDAEVETPAALLAAAERRLAALGTRLVVAPVPRKSALYRDFLPRGVDPRAELDDELVSALARRGVTVVDLPGLFRRHRESRPDELLYFQSDSHWTDRAQVLAAEEICRAAGRLAPANARLGRLVPLAAGPQERDHLDYIGLHVPARALDVLGLPPVARFGVERRGAVATTHDNPPTLPAAAIAVTGTSFTARRKLPLFLEHFCGQPVWNAADLGAYPLATLDRLLGETAGAPPVVVLEMPVHYVIGRRPLREIEPLLAGHPPPETPRLRLRRLATSARPGREESLRGRLELATLPAGRLVHSGDGVAALRLRGRARGTGLRLSVTVGDGTLRFPWPEDRREVVLPLIAGAPTGEAVAVALTGRGTFTLEDAEVTATLDATRAVAGRHARVEPRDGGWRQRLVFPDRPRIVRHAALLLRLDARGGGVGGRARLTVFAEGERLELDLAPVHARGTVLVGLGPLRGRRLVRAELAGDGVPPRRVVRSALFLPPGF